MINKIMLFGDFSTKDFSDFWGPYNFHFYKNSALLRLGNALYKEGFDVKQVHHCTSFNKEELKHLIETFSQDEKILICISSSFLATANRIDYRFHTDERPDVSKIGDFWGEKAFDFLKNIGYISNLYKIPVIMGGFDIKYYKFLSKEDWNCWGIDVLNYFIEYFIMGYSHKAISDYCKNGKLEYRKLFCENGRYVKLVQSNEITDWEDHAFTPTPGTYIQKGESLTTQLAGGCIFSCSFCTYYGLGKKPNEYARTYQSIKDEIVYNWENSNTRTYLFADNMVNDDWNKLEKLIRVKEETGIDIRWAGYVRLDTITTKEKAKLFRDSGAAGVVFGIESLKKEVGPYIGKMTDGEKVKELLHMFREAVGDTCMTSGSFIAGAPTETKEELHKHYEWLNSEEGKYLLNHYIFTPLFIEPGINSRTEINKKRNDPWKDYKFNENKKIRMRGTGWTSPWGTYDEFLELAIKYSNFNNKSLVDEVEDAMSARRGIFALPFISTLLNDDEYSKNGVDKYVSYCINQEPFHHTYRNMFIEKTKSSIENYRKNVLGNYYGSFDTSTLHV